MRVGRISPRGRDRFSARRFQRRHITDEVASRRIISRRMRMKVSTFFTRVFTWWNGQTFGTQVWTSLYGEVVGDDEFGNRYYRTKGGKIDPALGFERRWVIYNGYAEASTVGPA